MVLILGSVLAYSQPAYANEPNVQTNSELNLSDSTLTETINNTNVTAGVTPQTPDDTDIVAQDAGVSNSINPPDNSANDLQSGSPAMTMAPLGAAATLTAAPLPALGTISSAINTSQVIDVQSASVANGASVQIYANNDTPAQRFQIIPNSDGTYTFKNINSGLVLDLQYASPHNNAIVWQYQANGTDAQKWYITDMGDGYKISSKLDQSYCLNISSTNAASSTLLKVYADNGSVAQRFYFNAINQSIADGYYIIGSAAANYVLDIAWAGTADATASQLYTSNQTLAQRFSVSFDPQTGYYIITNVNSNKPLDIAGASRTAGARVQIYTSNNTFAQRFSITQNSDGSYRIGVSYSGTDSNLVVTTDSTAKLGSKVQTAVWSNTNNQKWQFTPSTICNEGIIAVRSALGTVLDAQYNGQTVGTRIWTYQANGSGAQKFLLQLLDADHCTLQCMNSGLVVGIQNGKIVLTSNQNLDTQIWQLTPAGNGRFFLTNKSSGLALDVTYGSTASGTYVQPYTLNKTLAQQWSIEATPYVRNCVASIFSLVDSTKALDIRFNSTAVGAQLQLYQANSTIAQIFQITLVSGINYRITCANSGKCLQVNGGIFSPKGIVQLANPLDNDLSQLWQFQYLGPNQYRICSAANSNYCLTIDGGSAVNSAEIVASPISNSQLQIFALPQALRMTVDQMVSYQQSGNPYISNITTSQLRDVIDPALTVLNYNFPGHPQQYTYGMMQFVDLRNPTGVSADQLNAIIAANAPANSTLIGQGQAFVDAANEFGINEVYLLAHCVLETGWGAPSSNPSNPSLAQGYYYDGTYPIDKTGTLYPAGTYYNMFGIGAVDSNVMSGGRATAISYGWDSVAKAIIGGAQWIAQGYIYRSMYVANSYYMQDTLYAMKWDVDRSNDDLAYGWHQYATDHLWARKIARLMGQFYNYLGVQPQLYYIVPFYSGS